jgi:hypothetical protein
MTSLSENTVVTTSGGLVELGYSQITTSVTLGTSSGIVIPSISVVCDGSPILVEFFAVMTTVGSGASSFGITQLVVDGSVAGRMTQSYTASAIGDIHFGSSYGSQRLTPSAGVHTFGINGYRSAAASSQINAGTGSGDGYPPAFIRISKVIQASQFIVPLASAPLVTSLPSAPIDGQEIRYVADATNGVIWNLRYRAASSSSYKWEFVGGPPLHNSNGSYPGAINSASYVDVPSGANVTAPLDGDYMVDFNGKADCTSSQYGSVNNVAVMTATVAPSDAKAAGVGTYTNSGGYVRASFSRLVNLDGVSAGETIKMRAKAAVGTVSVVYHYTGMSVTPIRVG